MTYEITCLEANELRGQAHEVGERFFSASYEFCMLVELIDLRSNADDTLKHGYLVTLVTAPDDVDILEMLPDDVDWSVSVKSLFIPGDDMVIDRKHAIRIALETLREMY